MTVITVITTGILLLPVSPKGEAAVHAELVHQNLEGEDEVHDARRRRNR